MVETDNIASLYERYLTVLKNANELNKSAVFAALSAACVELVTVTFDGEGDSGQIEEVAFFVANTSIPAPEATVGFQSVSWSCDTTAVTHCPLGEAVESLCYAFLSEAYGGWENNDGAYGDFTFDVAKTTIALNFNARFVDSTHYSKSF